jgi:hypothetical protein
MFVKACAKSCDFLTPGFYGQWLPIVVRQLFHDFANLTYEYGLTQSSMATAITVKTALV